MGELRTAIRHDIGEKVAPLSLGLGGLEKTVDDLRETLRRTR
jgi:hypothetical protein